jgi:PHP family Zn ribbon phosphoesterase
MKGMLQEYRADLHVHTVLSPCGSLDMSPARIISEAKQKHIDIMAITDHNSTRQCRVVMEMGRKAGIAVWGGAELNTREEVHCLAYFDEFEPLDELKKWLDRWLVKIKNNPDYFGDQVWVDEEENILGEEPWLLIAALDRSLDQCYEEVHRLGGVFVPAHIDRPGNSLSSQLGFVPPDIAADALEISPNVTLEMIEKYGWAKIKPLITGSDAHHPERLGMNMTRLRMQDTGIEEFKKALGGVDGREVVPEILKL